MAQLHVELVAADRKVWTGEAAMVITRTSEGEIGVLPGHTPTLGVLVNGVVQIRPVDGGEVVRAGVYGGFLSVADDFVSVLGEEVELGHEIDETHAGAELERAQAAGDADAESKARARLAASRR